MSLISSYIFFGIDQILPRKLACIPYQLALTTLSSDMASLGGITWPRNSFKSDSYVFGISDLDITVLTEDYSNKLAIIDAYKRHKKVYPFLGEINFYSRSDFTNFVRCLNTFERQRDPILENHIHEYKFNYDLKVEKVVFLLRMYFSDHVKLNFCPELRQKKWKSHFELLGLEVPALITSDIVKKEIIKLVGSDITEELTVLDNVDLSDEFLFHENFPSRWKFLFPHKYLWFDQNREEVFAGISGTIFQYICLRQIDWEYWGLMSQLPMLMGNEKDIFKHLKRLNRLASHLDAPQEMNESLFDMYQLFTRVMSSNR